jgi:trans-aconitate methyltransferase
VLDIGCGTGALSETIKRRQSAHVVGMERVPEMAEQAKNRLDDVIVGNSDELDLEATSQGARLIAPFAAMS